MHGHLGVITGGLARDLHQGPQIGIDRGAERGLVGDGRGGGYRPAPLLREMVAAGRLGRKSAQGFYAY